MEVEDLEEQVLPSDLGSAVSWHGLKSQLPVKKHLYHARPVGRSLDGGKRFWKVLPAFGFS